MAGISSKAAGKLENKYGITGKEKQSEEFSDGSGLEEYDFGARFYDPQIGRWHNIDPHVANYYWLSPYNYCNNNPLKYLDPSGMDPETSTKENPKDLEEVRIVAAPKPNNSLANRGFFWANNATTPTARLGMKRQDVYEQARSSGFSEADMTNAWKKRGIDDADLARFERGYQAWIDHQTMSLIAVGAIGAPILAIGTIEVGGALLATSSSELTGLGTYSLEQLTALTGPQGSAALMRTVLQNGLTLAEATKLGVDAGALQAYREIAVRSLFRYVLRPSAVGTAIQTERIEQIYKLLGY